MARKFTKGRQSEQLFNQELHDLFMGLKYLAYDYQPIKDEQAPIPDKAMWLDRLFGSDILKVYDKVNGDWIPAFKGYYHPANMLEKPANPAHGQGWIDYTKNNLLHYYDKNTDSWVPVSAVNNIEADAGAYHNYELLKLEKPILTEGDRKVFAVHNEKMGKLFDNRNYIHPSDPAYVPNSSVAIEYTDKDKNGKEAWVHVNSKRIDKAIKRLIKVNYDPNDSEGYMINISSHNTEFYGMDIETGLGHLLIPCDAQTKLEDSVVDHSHYDFHKTDTGIKLIHDKYKYIYAISYKFGDYINTPGKLIRNSGVIGTQDNIYIGATNKRVFVFLDGLYLEQDKYEYLKDSNSIRIINEDITQLMDLVAITVPDYSKVAGTDDPLEFLASKTTKTTLTKNLEIGENDVAVGPLTNAKDFKHPMAFIGGVHAHINSEPKEVEIIGDYAVIRNLGPMLDDDFYKVMLIEANGMSPVTGVVDETLRIHSDIITDDNEINNTKYLVFVEGVLASPRDLDVANGSIGVMGLKQGQKYLLLKSNSDMGVEAELMFDSSVSHFTTKIEDDNENTIYDNIDAAIVYADNGILIDRDAMIVDKLPVNAYEGQLVLLEDPEIINDQSTYTMWQYSVNKKTWVEIPYTSSPGVANEDFVNAYDLMFGYFANKGSISIINKKHVGKPYTYFVYSYVNSIDERLLWGDRITKIDQLDYAVNHRHKFNKNKGCLTAYINGLYTIVEEEPDNVEDTFRLDRWEELPTIGVEDNVNYEQQLESELNDPLKILDRSSLTYIVELPEGKEDVSMKREVLTTANKIEGSNIANTYETANTLTNGVVTVYVNGLRLTRDDFAIVSSNTITILRDTVGGQIISKKDDVSTYNKYMVMGEEGPVVLDFEDTDEIVVEVREDYTIKEITLPVRYERQRTFSVKTDGVPESLINSNDEIKIFINGVFYGLANKDNINKDMVTIDQNRKEITFNDEFLIENLHVDPIYNHFKLNPKDHDEYIKEYGQPYNAQIQENYITFEWR